MGLKRGNDSRQSLSCFERLELAGDIWGRYSPTEGWLGSGIRIQWRCWNVEEMIPGPVLYFM